MPLILPGNVATAIGGAYEVANSCRFNDDDSPDIRRTFGSAGDLDKWTFSCWYKRSSEGSATQRLFGAGSNNTTIYFTSNNKLAFYDAALDTGWDVQDTTHRLFPDISSWYHIVWTLDSAQAVAANRVKCYVNGVQQTLTKSGSGGDQNFTTAINTAVAHFIGKRPTHSTGYLDGYLAEVVFNDGQAYAASDYGLFDEDSPTIWKPKDVSGLTFGTNGFYLDFEDSGTLGNDANGGTDWTATNLAATDQTSDTCTNNFATLNPLVVINGSTFSEGNCKVVTGSSPYSYDVSTFGVSAGKWYVEAKYGGSSDDATFGIAGRTATNTTHELGHYDDTWSYYTGTGASNVRNNNSNSSYGNTYAANDIIGLALDLTNNKLYFSKNGTWQNSGDPESGSTGTGAVTITAASSVTDGVYYIGIGDFDGGASVTWEINFGNPSFSISSGNADADGYGNFEYAVPSGYFSLCTKNLAEYGG